MTTEDDENIPAAHHTNDALTQQQIMGLFLSVFTRISLLMGRVYQLYIQVELACVRCGITGKRHYLSNMW